MVTVQNCGFGGFTLESTKIRAKDVLGNSNVLTRDGTIWQVFYGNRSKFGIAWMHNDILQPSSRLCLSYLTLGVALGLLFHSKDNRPKVLNRFARFELIFWKWVGTESRN